MKKRKLFVSLLSAMAIASTTVLGAAAAHYKGDINRDDSVSVSDIVSIQKHLAGKSSIAADKLIYADLNDDGKVNIFDFVNAVRVVLGSAPLEEVPSLTTPAVTTTITTTTSTTVSTTSTTPVTTTTTTPKATTATSTTTTPETTTTTTTTATETSTTETTTVTETTVTSTEISTSATEAVVSTEETTSAAETTSVTESEITASETTTTAAETTTTAPTSTTAGTTYTMAIKPAGSEKVELDTTKDIDYIEFEVGTTNNFNLHIYVGYWNAWVNVQCENGVVTQISDEKNIENITIDGNKIKVEFAEGVRATSEYNGIYFVQNNGSADINLTVTNIVMVGDETTDPVETTATTSATATNTTTTAATTTVTESETTKAPESSVTAEATTTAGEITSVTSSEAETTASETVATTTATSAVTTTSATETEEAVTTTLVINADTAIELDSTKELDKMTLTVDTSSNYKLVFLFGSDWNTFINLYCNNGVLTEEHGSLIEAVEIEDGEVTITFKSGLKIDALTLYNNNSTITITDYDIAYVGDAE